jgi:hypothetical protein
MNAGSHDAVDPIRAMKSHHREVATRKHLAL